MTTQFIRRSLELTAEQWAALERIAADLGATAPTGPTAGQPSWRTLVKAITDGSLSITRKDTTDATA